MRTFILTLVIILCSISLLADAPLPDFKEIVRHRVDYINTKAKSAPMWKEYFEREAREMEDYDVLYYKIDLDVDFDNQLIFGNNIIRVEIVEDQVSNLVVDFTDSLTVDEIYLEGNALNFTHQDYQINIDLGQSYPQGSILELNIQYHGHPVEPTFNCGFVFLQHSGEDIAFTKVEPYASRDWWPCKDVPRDKPDSIDVWITCPDIYLCASNGLLQEEIINGDSTKTFKWHESYPIATYLVSVAITNYQLYSIPYYSSSDTMYIDNYLFPEQYDEQVAFFDTTSTMIDFLSSVYCTYPFIEEKYGHAVYPGNGAMEHQTCTSFGSNAVNEYGSYTVLHELAHQWVGDLITCETWSNIWLNEGFAVYSEVLWTENLWGIEAYHEHINQLDLGSYIDDKLQRDEGGSGSHIMDIVVYFKGAWTLHMLRGIVGDSVMMQILQNYVQQPDLRYGTATTDDFCNVAEQVSGMELSWFFDQWFYNVGRPQYKYATYTSEEIDSVKITLLSEGSQGEPFAMYIPYNMNGQSGTVWADSVFNYYTFPLDSTLDSLKWDTDNWVLDYGYEEQIPELEEITPSKGSILLIWKDFFDTGIEGINIYRKESGGEYTQINAQPITGIMYIDEDVTMAQTYFYKIAAVTSSNGNYISKFSNEVSATPFDFTFTLDQGIFLVDETNNSNPALPTDAEVDSFYNYLLNNYSHTDWDTDELGLPPLSEMAKYSTIIWHSEDLMPAHFSDNPYNLMSYLVAGGNLFISGWRHLMNIPSDVYQDYLHLTTPEYNPNPDFMGAFGESGFPNLNVDSSRVPIPIWEGNLAYIYKFVPYGDAETVYRFDSATADSSWENKPCAIRYNDNYKLYFLGFPLYYMDIEASAQFMGLVLQDFGENVSVDDNYTLLNNKISLINYPNPFFAKGGSISSENPATRIRFNIPKGIHCQNMLISIYNVKGQLVKKFNLKKSELQEYELTWDGKDMNSNSVNSGVYFIRLQIDDIVLTRKAVLLK